MVTRVKILKDFDVEGKPLIVGLPGMGRVGFIATNYLRSNSDSTLVAEIYSTSFPPHLIVRKDGVSELFVGKLYNSPHALFFTADTQPQSPEGQNEVCDALLKTVTEKGELRSVISTAAFVVPEVSEERATYVAGNDPSLIKELKDAGGIPLNEGVIMGVNGAIVGWAKYYGVKGAVLLGETWSAIVEFDEPDYRAAKAVINTLSKYLGLRIDVSRLDALAVEVESKIANALTKLAKSASPEKGPRKEVL
jgi:proteasome assembly chaperone (PAC2) family protein